MDASGLGDSDRSAPAPEGGGLDAYRLAHLRLYRPEYLDDIRSAIDMLEQRGFRECILGGVCSGANLALHSALADTRVAGLLLINLPFFGRRRYAAEPTIRAGAFHPLVHGVRRWRRALISSELRRRTLEMIREQRVLAQRTARRVNTVIKAATGIEVFVNEASRMMRRLAGRTPGALFIYSAGDPGLAVFESNFGRRGWRLLRDIPVKLAIMPGADHTFDHSSHRDRLIALIVDHLTASCTVDRPADAPAVDTLPVKSDAQGRPGPSRPIALGQPAADCNG